MAAICVFCASSSTLEQRWLDLARQLGQELGAARSHPGLRRRLRRHDGRGRRRRPGRRRAHARRHPAVAGRPRGGRHQRRRADRHRRHGQPQEPDDRAVGRVHHAARRAWARWTSCSRSGPRPPSTCTASRSCCSTRTASTTGLLAWLRQAGGHRVRPAAPPWRWSPWSPRSPPAFDALGYGAHAGWVSPHPPGVTRVPSRPAGRHGGAPRHALTGRIATRLAYRRAAGCRWGTSTATPVAAERPMVRPCRAGCETAGPAGSLLDGFSPDAALSAVVGQELSMSYSAITFRQRCRSWCKSEQPERVYLP